MAVRRVHVVAEDHERQVAALLGHCLEDADGADGLLPAPQVEVVRRASEVLTFRLPPEERQPGLDRLVAVLQSSGGGRRPVAPGVPPRQRAWLLRSGRRAARRLVSGGYEVHGRVTSLGRVGGPTRPAGVRDGAVLTALLEAVLLADAARVEAEGRGTRT